MIRTGDEYRASIRDGREVYIDGERVDDVTTHPAFKPIVDVRARIYDMAHEPDTQLAAVYRTFDWQGPLDVVRYSAGLSERVTGRRPEAVGT
jgi:aromatic ring hydroxylase